MFAITNPMLTRHERMTVWGRKRFGIHGHLRGHELLLVAAGYAWRCGWHARQHSVVMQQRGGVVRGCGDAVAVHNRYWYVAARWQTGLLSRFILLAASTPCIYCGVYPLYSLPTCQSATRCNCMSSMCIGSVQWACIKSHAVCSAHIHCFGCQ